METKLTLISEKASKDKKYKFNNLAYLLNEENLIDCFLMLKTGKATGVDGITLEKYEENLRNNIKDLISKMKRQAYKPQPSKRTYIKKTNGKMRPLGIPSTEDKIVQMGIARILESIYENDFLNFSYGFRPNRSCHDAIKNLNRTIISKPVSYIIDADIKGFFDNVNHDWMMRFLEERITDTNLLRIIKRFLIAGIMEKNEYQETEKGTPQGGIISPILANLYLHYALDLWIEKVVKKESRGLVEIIRYADDFVICVQYKDEAENLLNALKLRLQKFGLELAEGKTRIIEFGRYAKEKAEKKGKSKPETFNFLGFTFYCSLNRKGNFNTGVKTERKKFCLKLKEMNKWLKEIRAKDKVKDWWQILCSKLRGHYQYFGISGNYKSIGRFFYLTVKLLYKWLNRRSQKKSFTWDMFNKYMKEHKLPLPRIKVSLYV
jgi:RNA-directed DNA polymerase